TRSNPARLFEQSRIVTPPWAKLPRHGTVVGHRPSQLARKRRPDRSKVGTLATQRLKRRRYMGPSHAASAMRGNSRQTDLKHTHIAFELRGFATLRDVCLSPASHGSNVLGKRDVPSLQRVAPRTATIIPSASISSASICGVRAAFGR